MKGSRRLDEIHPSSCMVQEAGGPHNGPRPNPTEYFFMKKSLIALAVLATTGAAMAQSNVTL